MTEDPCDWPRLLQACVHQAYNAVVVTNARLDPPAPRSSTSIPPSSA